jgi:tetratricopeptide (TPR) repeat protein
VSYVFKFDFVASFLIFTALINIHHFVLDGVIWKLRDGRVAALLIDTKKQISNQAASAGNSLVGALKWFFAPSFVSRAVRVVLIGALVILAGVDVAKFYLGSDESNEARLARAESLNPYDQSVLLRLARAHGQDGQLDKTIATLERAVLVNPENPGPQNQLARLLIENQRYERAYQHYEQMLRRLPRDVDALVNFGILAAQLKRDDKAIESWERAIALDPAQKNILRYLADAYDRQGKSEQATLSYERYLAALAQQNERLDPKEVISLTLKLAEDYARQGQFDRALAYGQNAASLASQAGEKAMMSASYSVLAQLNNEMGRRGEAMVLHQRAIQLDREIGDTRQEGLDWFKFAQTMRLSRKPARLVLASLLRAERLLSSNPGTEFDMVVDARRQEEATAGKDAAIADKELESILSDLLVTQP